MSNGDLEPRVRALLEQARQEVGQAPPLAPRVRARLDGVTMAPRRGGRPLLLLAGAGVLGAALACAAWSVLRAGGRQRGPADRPIAARLQPLPQPVAALTVGETTLAQHLSMLVDSRAVLVLWSRHDGEFGPGAPTDGPMCRREGYTEWRLGSGSDPDGATWQWSLFIADPDVQVLAAPPAVRARDPRAGAIQLAVNPRPSSWEEVRRALDSTAAGARSAPDLERIRSLVVDRTQGN